MKQIALYTSFATASIADASIFLSTTNYIQLAVAVILYLSLVIFALKIFPRRRRSPVVQTVQKEVISHHSEPEQENRGGVEILDIDKRAFLKIIGATGLSFFISSIITKRFGTFLGRADESGTTMVQDSSGNLISPAKHHPTDNYIISNVDYGINTYYGFIDQGDGWFIMKEDINNGTYRYIKGNSNFDNNWNSRENLKYDYFNRVFPQS